MKLMLRITRNSLLSVLLFLVTTASYGVGAVYDRLNEDDIIQSINETEMNDVSTYNDAPEHTSFNTPDLTPEMLREILPFTSLAYRFGKNEDDIEATKKTKKEINYYERQGWVFEPFFSEKGFQSIEKVHALYNSAAKTFRPFAEDVVFAENDLSGFVAIKETSSKEYVISIAPHGSQNLTDWLMNGLFLKDDLSTFGLAGKGHMGFAIAAKKAIPPVYEAIKKTLVSMGALTAEEVINNDDVFKLAKDKGLSLKVYPVGHSLGAAIAKLIAVFMAQDMSLTSEMIDDELGSIVAVSYDNTNESESSSFKVVSVSVGGPRVMDKVAAREQEKALGGAHNIIQFVDYGDPVVFQPFQVLGYWHSGTIIPVSELTPYCSPRDDIGYTSKLIIDVMSLANNIYSRLGSLVSSSVMTHSSGLDKNVMMAFGQSVLDVTKDTALALHSNSRYIAKVNDSNIYENFYYSGMKYNDDLISDNNWAQWWFGAIDNCDKNNKGSVANSNDMYTREGIADQEKSGDPMRAEEKDNEVREQLKSHSVAEKITGLAKDKYLGIRRIIIKLFN